ncbi:MAG: hypothetical protein K6B14_01405 [Lachnospiraceae bacterium]|nr:hypothetical protein [Lachnospiraceae bacterium]
MSLAVDSIVTIYSDTMAFILTLGIFAISSRFKVGNDKYADKMFSRLCILTMVNALTNGVSYTLHHQITGWPAIVRMIFPTIAEYSALIVLFGWFVYIDYKLYGSGDRIRVISHFFQVPIYIMGVLCLVNLFTGIMFEVTEDHIFVAKPLFYVMTILQYAYGILPILAVIRYRKMKGKLHFFHITPIVIPVLTAGIFTLLTDYSARAFGFAIALVLLRMSYINLWRFEDMASGFYNRYYINHIADMSRENKLDYHSAIEFITANTPGEFYDILNSEMPGNAEIIRMDTNRFLLFSESSKSSMITLLSSMIQDASDEYDRQHQEEGPIDLLISYRIRKRNESAEEFIRGMAEA